MQRGRVAFGKGDCSIPRAGAFFWMQEQCTQIRRGGIFPHCPKCGSTLINGKMKYVFLPERAFQEVETWIGPLLGSCRQLGWHACHGLNATFDLRKLESRREDCPNEFDFLFGSFGPSPCRPRGWQSNSTWSEGILGTEDFTFLSETDPALNFEPAPVAALRVDHTKHRRVTGGQNVVGYCCHVMCSGYFVNILEKCCYMLIPPDTAGSSWVQVIANDSRIGNRRNLPALPQVCS